MKTIMLKRLGLIVFVSVLAAGFAFSQAGRGIGRIGGVVVDLDGNPIEGAKVTIAFAQNQNLKFETTTNKKGDWSFLGLGTGNWDMTAAMAGYLPQNKTLYVSQLAVNPKVTVKLQKLAKGASGGIGDEKSFELLDKGNQSFKEAKYDEAMALYQQFLEKNPNLYQIQASIGDCYKEKGEFDKAIEIYNKVLEQATTDAVLGKEMAAKALAGIGSCYLKQNKLQEAQDFFKKSIENSPNDEILAYNVGEICFSSQNLDDALKYFDLSAQIKPDWPDPYLKLGYVYLNKADTAKAIEKFEKFLALEPEGERAALARNILNAIKK